MGIITKGEEEYEHISCNFTMTSYNIFYPSLHNSRYCTRIACALLLDYMFRLCLVIIKLNATDCCYHRYCSDIYTALIEVCKWWSLKVKVCQSQFPRGLRHELSSLALTLGSWVRIPLKAWMSACVYSVFVLGSGLATGWPLVQGVLPNVLD
jgi:hypothetical protein